MTASLSFRLWNTNWEFPKLVDFWTGKVKTFFGTLKHRIENIRVVHLTNALWICTFQKERITILYIICCSAWNFDKSILGSSQFPQLSYLPYFMFHRFLYLIEIQEEEERCRKLMLSSNLESLVENFWIYFSCTTGCSLKSVFYDHNLASSKNSF